MKKGKVNRLILILCLVLAITILSIILLERLGQIDLGISFIKEDKSAVSFIILEEARDAFSLNTLEIIHKAVFPYDFIPRDYNWYLLFNKSRDERNLSSLEKEYLKVFNLARTIGINLAVRDYKFLVATATVRIGYTQPALSDMEKLFSLDQETGILKVRLPEPEVTDFILEDPRAGSYGYPDIQLSPENWRMLSQYLTAEIKKKVFTEEIRELAYNRGKTFLEEFLKDA